MTFDWRAKRAAVIGGGGFLGHHVVNELRRRECDPVVPRTADGWDFRQLESALEFFAEHRPQIVFNCAARQGGLAYQQKFPADIFDDNLLLGFNTMRAARDSSVEKYVNVVAACSYPGYLDGLMSEDDYWNGPLHDTVLNYGFTKKSQVVQGWCYRRQYDFNSIHLLMTNLYGPGEHFHPDRSHGLAALVRKFYDAKRNSQKEVVIWGTGKPVREWLFVRDAAEALVMAAESYNDAAPINVSLGGGLSIYELALLIQELVGYEGELVYDRSKPDGALMKAFDNTRCKKLIGWEPKTSLREGIKETLAWLAANYEEATSAR
jgi:GDP-L-fucose synthase